MEKSLLQKDNSKKSWREEFGIHLKKLLARINFQSWLKRKLILIRSLTAVTSSEREFSLNETCVSYDSTKKVYLRGNCVRNVVSNNPGPVSGRNMHFQWT